ncbi:MAG: FdhF/YdeP family oxidoreductase [Candidatus Thalassarchaeaceae archaeon]|nr:FdhF/YdeP family oxidoreductase [Candidatus Thalassarchaeaceae archaeon]
MARGVKAQPPIEKENLKVGPTKKVAAGLVGVQKSFDIGLSEAGIARTIKTMRTVNRFDGFDCPGCAWPDPDDHRSGFEFCENGAKAFATEATKKRATPEMIGSMTVKQLSEMSDMELDKMGRITNPMILREESERYEEIGWEEAFSTISQATSALSSPKEAVLYTSGRTSNEAAFLWGTLARQIGTNNLPDCSNMCHESSGYALGKSIGIGKGTVKLSCFDKADLILVIGQNPGTNHPRMLTALSNCKKNGGSIISINPLEETAMRRFKHPQNPLHMLGSGTQIADEHIPVRIGGDAALLQGFAKVMIDEDSFDHAFIDEHTIDFDEWKKHIQSSDWDEIVLQSGISKTRIEEIGKVISKSRRMIVCWAMGLTQHENSVGVIQEIANLLLAGGHFGKPGAGACPVRGHSNVQGDRTVGINHHPSEEFLSACEDATGIDMPRERGYDAVDFVHAALDDNVRLYMAMGGNFVSAMSDTERVAEAISNIDLTVQISTKMNRSHLVTGKSALILPCLGRTEKDPAGFVTVENSMGVVHPSTGSLEPASQSLLSEPEIVCRIGKSCFPKGPFNWQTFTNYDETRDLISRCIPGFEDYNSRVREKGGFYLPNGPRDGPVWKTPSGKAHFFCNNLPERRLREGSFVMMTVRSHDQYNTTIYGMDDRYRGIYNSRRIVMMNPVDMEELRVVKGQEVDITSHWGDRDIHSERWKVVPYEIPKGNLCSYFPEANVLVPLESTAEGSNTPTSKWIEVTLSTRKARFWKSSSSNLN